MALPEAWFELGTVLRAHGIKGQVRVFLDVDDPKAYAKLKTCWLDGPTGPAELKITALHLQPQPGMALLALEGVTTRTQAETLAGRSLLLPLSLLPQRDENHFYYHELPGLAVHDQVLGPLGVVKEVQEWPAQDLLVVLHPAGTEVLVPITDAFVPRIDREAGILHTHVPDGLLDVFLKPGSTD